MVSFLQPLNDVTHFLFKSNYPTLNIALPMYISLIKDIISVLSQFKTKKILSPAKKMILNLKKYLVLASHVSNIGLSFEPNAASKARAI
ncbi:uncharacterized protein VP01_2384g2 [Puccinia sorghi]|uniref:HAT C-terminal dimerisation domain-containing protein n=1 Tax=Puccinia sorghi TaxID=27349 RepID=A0A0L6V6U7_9BASI|nr:uncharacterized protein VP01_2384g2 [Puccinia sorghi]